MIPHLSSLITAAAPALANHLWQSTAFAAAIWLLTLLLRNNHARIRYNLWLAASIKFLIPFSLLITLGTYLPKPQQIVPPSTIYSAIDTASQPFKLLDIPIAPATPTPTPTLKAHLITQLPAALATLWLCGALIVLLIWITRWRQVHAVLKKSTPITQGREHEILQRLQTQSSKQITLLRSPDLMEPGIFGILRPTLLWPARLSDQLEDHHIQAILAHETIHVQRRDNLTAALHMLVEAIFWFHPIVWWMERHMIEERERACDEAVIQQGGNPETYAESLLKACRFCLESPLPCIAGITGAELSRRVRSIMTLQLQQLGLTRKLLLAASAFAAFAGPIVLGALHAQPVLAQLLQANPASRPSFEVATVRPSNPDPTNKASMDSGIRISANRFVALNMTAKQLLMLAYDIQPGAESRIITNQNWISTNHYNIEAILDDSSAAKPDSQKMNQIPLMMQSLLADRFKLKISPSTRQQSVYALVQTKNGAKLTESTRTLPSFEPPHPGPGGIKNDSGIFIGVAATSSQLADDLTMQPEVGGRVVLDQTSLKGRYDFTLKWSPDQGIDAASAHSSDSNLPSGPSLFTALQEQLGLKLQPTKGPVEVLVIDHIEQPTGDPGGEAPPTPTQSKSAPASTPSFEVTTVQPATQSSGAGMVPAGGQEFDVASVKENRTGSHDMKWGCRGTDGQTLSEVTGSGLSLVASSSIPSGRCVVHNVPLQWVIALAYRIPWNLENQVILGGPNWVSEGLNSSARFDIETETDQAATLAQMLPMLQRLLAKRFALKLHVEERPQPVFELVAAKKGVKLTKAPSDRDCTKVITGEPLCHELRGGFGNGLTGRSVTMDELATRLSRYTGRPVVNKTGIDGVYDVKTSDFWMPFPNEKEREVPTIFEMLEQQLGLHLKAAKDPFQVLVVDAAEMPKSSDQ